jgi:hypothetical protein
MGSGVIFIFTTDLGAPCSVKVVQSAIPVTCCVVAVVGLVSCLWTVQGYRVWEPFVSLRGVVTSLRLSSVG